MTASTLERMQGARAQTRELVASLDDEVLHRPLAAIMSPLVWDLGHIAAYEDLWAVHRLAGEPLLHPELAAAYDAFETPRTVRAEIELLDRAGAEEYLDAVRDRAVAVLERAGPSELHELVLRHELQHGETMRQAMFLGGLPAGRDEHAPVIGAGRPPAEMAGGPAWIGADADGFAYDNERPRHEVSLAPYRIARTPVSEGEWAEFIEAGGYRRREWWSAAGWDWKEQEGAHAPAGWTGVTEAQRPVEHVCFHEAEAFARSRQARLPTEQEWEAAAMAGVLEATGVVWEWTASEFTGYPGFRAHPYREYSEVFFDQGYRVLRGGSWATHRWVAGPTFRNWDLPQRRQIFAGARLAWTP